MISLLVSSGGQVGGRVLADAFLAVAPMFPGRISSCDGIGIGEVIVSVAQADSLAVREVMVNLGHVSVAVVCDECWDSERCR